MGGTVGCGCGLVDGAGAGVGVVVAVSEGLGFGAAGLDGGGAEIKYTNTFQLSQILSNYLRYFPIIWV